VTWERRGTTAFITFDRPAARNAMTWAMYEQLGAALDAIDADPEVRAAVLRGAGGCFVAGTDIAQFADFTTGDDGVAYERRLDSVLDRLERLAVPTIAVIEGMPWEAGWRSRRSCASAPDALAMPIARAVGNCLDGDCDWSCLGSARLAQLIFWPIDAGDQALARAFVLEIVDRRGSRNG
jgi:hypothetical protein